MQANSNMMLFYKLKVDKILVYNYEWHHIFYLSNHRDVCVVVYRRIHETSKQMYSWGYGQGTDGEGESNNIHSMV